MKKKEGKRGVCHDPWWAQGCHWWS